MESDLVERAGESEAAFWARMKDRSASRLAHHERKMKQAKRVMDNATDTANRAVSRNHFYYSQGESPPDESDYRTVLRSTERAAKAQRLHAAHKRAYDSAKRRYDAAHQRHQDAHSHPWRSKIRDVVRAGKRKLHKIRKALSNSYDPIAEGLHCLYGGDLIGFQECMESVLLDKIYGLMEDRRKTLFIEVSRKAKNAIKRGNARTTSLRKAQTTRYGGGVAAASEWLRRHGGGSLVDKGRLTPGELEIAANHARALSDILRHSGYRPVTKTHSPSKPKKAKKSATPAAPKRPRGRPRKSA